jgi:segregation and condensation protein B
VSELARIVEALLFLSSEPVSAAELAEACELDGPAIAAAIEELRGEYAEGRRGLVLREVAGGFTLASDPLAEAAARRLLAKPRIAALTAAQLETLAIVAYLQPISRPEIARIRGVNADSPVASLLDRGLIEESGRSSFGAVMYRTTTLFLKLFGLQDTGGLPEVSEWDPSPEQQVELRERLLRAGEARAGIGSPGGHTEADAVPGSGPVGPPIGAA